MTEAGTERVSTLPEVLRVGALAPFASEAASHRIVGEPASAILSRTHSPPIWSVMSSR